MRRVIIAWLEAELERVRYDRDCLRDELERVRADEQIVAVPAQLTKRCCGTCMHSSPIEEAGGQIIHCASLRLSTLPTHGGQCLRWRVKR